MFSKIVSFNPINIGAYYAISSAISALIQIIFFVIVTSKSNANLQVAALVQPIVAIPISFIGGAIIAALYNFCANHKLGDKLNLEFSDNPMTNESVFVHSIDVISTGRVYGFIFAFVGVFVGVIFSILGLVTKKYGLVAMIIVYPILCLIGGVIGGIITAFVYNFVAHFTKGYEVFIKMDGNEKGRVNKLGPVQMGKVTAFILGVLSVIGVLVLFLVSLAVAKVKFQLAALGIPIIAVLGGFIGGCLYALITNIILSLCKGIEVGLSGIPTDGGSGDSESKNEEQSA